MVASPALTLEFDIYRKRHPAGTGSLTVLARGCRGHDPLVVRLTARAVAVEHAGCHFPGWLMVSGPFDFRGRVGVRLVTAGEG